MYGIHTFRVESIAHGKAAPVDELQVQGVSNPGLLRKVLGYFRLFINYHKYLTVFLYFKWHLLSTCEFGGKRSANSYVGLAIY